jgi:hypothetical protein
MKAMERNLILRVQKISYFGRKHFNMIEQDGPNLLIEIEKVR